MSKSKKKNYIKVIDEKFIVPIDKGGGIIKFEAWEYDNSHNFHHKHYFGQITELDDFINYQELVQRFKNDIKEFIKW